MAAERTVKVTFSGFENPLTIDEAELNLCSNEVVRWTFSENVPTGCLTYIHFELPFGPFQCLSLWRDDATGKGHVMGKGNSGIPGRYSYKALVISPNNEVATSIGHSYIENHSIVKDTSPHAVVFHLPGKKDLSILPPNLKLQVGETATWHIVGVPEDHFVTFDFPEFTSDPLTGPFTSLELNRTLVEGPIAIRIANGEGYKGALDPAKSKQVVYRIQVRDAAGKVIARGDDPLIDTLGDPPH